jgi:hypothetical protein
MPISVSGVLDVLLHGPRRAPDLAGNLYVVEIAHNSLASDAPAGALLRVSPDGKKTTVVLDQGLSFPTSVAIAESGNLLMTNCGVCPGGGEVLEIVP